MENRYEMSRTAEKTLFSASRGQIVSFSCDAVSYETSKTYKLEASNCSYNTSVLFNQCQHCLTCRYVDKTELG